MLSVQPHACALFGCVATGFACFINTAKVMMVRKILPVKLKIEMGYTHTIELQDLFIRPTNV